MITSVEELRQYAVRIILRQGALDYLLRHALCKPWIESCHLDEMAWTDFKKLYFNFPKILSRLNDRNIERKQAGNQPLDPGDYTTAFMAALAHECLHVLWLHKYRSKGKIPHIWAMACEYAINLELAVLVGKNWIDDLDVCYPSEELLSAMAARDIKTTTDGFYEMLVQQLEAGSIEVVQMNCKFCERCKDDAEDSIPHDEIINTINQSNVDEDERADILRFILSEGAVQQKVPWEMLLLGGIENAMNQEQSWAAPSRRNDLLPGWRHEKLLNFVWILDVSPSIDDMMKQSFMNTLQAGINLYHDAQHRVIFFAEDIVKDMMVSSGTNLSQMEIPCGNGTDLEEVWEVLERDMPEYALVLTDLELTPVPKPSITKIVWGIVGDRQMFYPDYGIKVMLK